MPEKTELIIMNANNKKKENAGVASRISLITGDPKKAIRTLSVPMVISMLLIMAYNLADSIWVAGLGSDSLAALGFITPLFMIIIGLGNGLGAGANSLIARSIGAKDKKRADNAAMHSILITVVISIVVPLVLLISLTDILLIMGAGSTADLAVQYGQIVFGGMIFLIFSSVAASILRSEGDVNRAMYAMVATAVLNIIIDPIFIYYMGWGIAGAAWATLLSSAISSFLILYWLVIKKNTYITLSLKEFKFSPKIVKDLLRVGLPASAETLVMSILSIILNAMLVIAAGTDAVAAYTAGWRVVMMALIPPIGIGTAAITVAGAAYGAKKFKNLSIAFNYSIKLGIGIGIIIGIISYIFAPSIATIFTYSPQSAHLAPTIAEFLRVMCLFYITVPLGILASSVFQAMGKGLTSLILTVIREVAFVSILAYLFTFVFNMGEKGVWWGIVIGGGMGCVFAYIWAMMFIKRLKKNYVPTTA
jgi:putative MATE family efflux protein